MTMSDGTNVVNMQSIIRVHLDKLAKANPCGSIQSDILPCGSDD